MSTLAFTLTLPLGHFQIPSAVLVLGVITGTTYALFAVGITLVYQNSRVINFAQGAMGALPHIMVASLVIDHGWSYWAALPLALAAATLGGALLEIGVIRRLTRSPRLVVLIATIGAAQLFAVPGLFFINLSKTRMGRTGYPVPLHASIQLGSLKLTGGYLLILITAPVIVVALNLFLRRTSLGLASRAMAENSEAAGLAGLPVRRVSLIVWSLSGLLAGLAAILGGPTQPILSTALFGGGSVSMTSASDLLLVGLGAAMIGGLSSLPQVFAAGVGLGVIQYLVNWNYPAGGASQVVIAVIVVAALVVRRDLRQAATRGGEGAGWSLSGRLAALPEHIRRRPGVRRARWGLGAAALLLVTVVLPLPAGQPQLVLYSAIAIYVMIALSLVILTGWGGQVSLGHFTFVALGAFLGGRLEQMHYPVYGAVFITLVVAAGVSILVGLPALRLKGLFLAVTTLAFAVAFNAWAPHQDWLVHANAAGSSLQLLRPHWLGIDFDNERSFYYVVLALTIAVLAMVVQLRRTGMARSFMAVRDNEPMAASLSVAPAGAKLTSFVISGVVAALAGFLYGMLLVNFQYANLSDPSLSETVMIMVILGGATSPMGAVLGALYVRGLPYFFHSQSAQLLSSGAGVLAVLLFVPGGLASVVVDLRDRILGRLVPGAWRAEGAERPAEATPGAVRLDAVAARARPAAEAAPAGPAEDAPALPWPITAEDVMVRFGGLTALGGVSVHAAPGEIVGLLGPNGAGKTTLFDVLSGHVAPGGGRVLLDGEDVTSLPPEERAVRGLARSFQQARLFEDLTIVEAFQVALERPDPSELVPSLLGLPPARYSEREKLRRAREIVSLLGLEAVAERKAAELSTGTRRIAELGCVLALEARVVLLDEPTAGIAQREVEAFTPLLRRIRDHLDATMIVVSHDVPMMVGLVDRVYVLSSGLVIAEEQPDRLHENEAVVTAYLGAADDSAGAPPTRILEEARP